MKTKPYTMLLMMLAGWINRQQQEAMNYLMEENKILKHELLKATGRKRIILNDRQRRRLAILAKRVGRKVLYDISGVFSPDTLLAWYRKLVAAKYDGSRSRSKYGRRIIQDEVRQQIIDIARDHKHLGCRKLYGYLKYLGFKVSPASVSRILREAGIEPSPDRPERTTWSEFVKSHWESLCAIDFFTKEIFTKHGLVKFMVLVAIDYKTRKVEIAGIIPEANGVWMKQMAKNLTDPFDGFMKDKKFVVMDQDPIFTEEVRLLFEDAGVSPVRTTPASPNLNPFAERFIRSIKHECLNKMIIFGEKHLRYCIEQYCDFYHTARPHGGLDYEMIEPPPKGKGEVVCKEWLGGTLKSWHRAA